MKLIIFSDLPGTGHSALAETMVKELCIPVFAKHWMEANLESRMFVLDMTNSFYENYLKARIYCEARNCEI